MWRLRSFRRPRAAGGTPVMHRRFAAELACSVTGIHALVKRLTPRRLSLAIERHADNADAVSQAVAAVRGSPYLQQASRDPPQSSGNVTGVSWRTPTELVSMLAHLRNMVRRARCTAGRSWQRSGACGENRSITSRTWPGRIVSSHSRSGRSDEATADALREKYAASVRTGQHRRSNRCADEPRASSGSPRTSASTRIGRRTRATGPVTNCSG